MSSKPSSKFSRWAIYRVLRFLLISITIFAIALTWGTSASSQIPSFGESPSTELKLPPSGVSRYGALEVAWVRSPISGDNLFQIASPTVLDRGNLEMSQMPVEVRAKNIEDLLWLETTRFRENAFAQLFNPVTQSDKPETRSAQVIISTLKNLQVLQISNSANSRPLTISTVTPADTDFYSETPEQLAQQWKEILENEIAAIKTIYSPQFLQQRLQQTAAILLGIILLTGLFGSLYWKIGSKQKRLTAQYAAEVEAAASTQPPAPQVDILPTGIQSQSQAKQIELSKSRQFFHLLGQQFHLANRLDIYKFARWFLLWLMILVWYLGVYVITTRLPILMQWSNKVLTQPLNLILIWFLMSLMMRVSNFLIQRSINTWKENPYLDFGEAQRKVLRYQTIVGALQGLSTCILFLLGVLLTLIEFGLPTSSILTGSAVLGLALSFGSQNLVKDLVNGCLILLEDQFAVGDIITANGESGLVEKLNLRLTQLRNIDGELISIPNSSITLVKNKTSSWSRVNLGIEVAYNTDLDHAIAVIGEVAHQMSQDSDWKSFILEPPQVLGVDAFGDNSITIRLWIRTEPLQQWQVAREFRRRLKNVFDKEGISIPFPQQSIWFENTLPTVGMNHHSSQSPVPHHPKEVDSNTPSTLS